MLEKIFLSVLNMSFTASFVILLVIVARLFLKKAPKVFSYALWSVVLFRLICPFSFESVLSLLPVKSKPIPTDIIYEKTPQINTGIDRIDNIINPILPQATPQVSVNPMQVIVFISQIIWILGIICLLTYSIISLIKLKSSIKSSINTKSNIYLSDKIEIPFVLGVINPKIYLPSTLTDSQKDYILLHEQTHIKRLDHIVKIVSFLVLCVHWFNPLVWVAFFLSGKDMEMSCDERVIKTLGNDVKKEYSTSLLALATGKNIVSGTPLAFSEGDTKGRIKNVLNYKKPAFWVIIIALIGVIGVSIGLILNPKGNDDFIYFNFGVNGEIIEIDYENKTFMIKSDTYSVVGDKCFVDCKEAEVLKVIDNEPIEIDFSDLTVGDAISFDCGEIEETYPTKTKATRVQLGNQSVNLQNLWENRTEYVGDNSKVGGIIYDLDFPNNVKYKNFELQTNETPYGITVNFTADTDTKNFFTGALNQFEFEKNAYIMFSLIENVDTIMFSLDDGKNPYSFEFYRSQFIDKFGEDYFANTETYDGFVEVFNKINEEFADRKYQSDIEIKDTPNTPTAIGVPNLENTEKIVLLKNFSGNTDIPIKHKIVQDKKDIDDILTAINNLTLKEAEAIYGGENIEIWIYDSNGEVTKITMHEKNLVTYKGMLYQSKNSIDFFEKFNSIKAEEKVARFDDIFDEETSTQLYSFSEMNNEDIQVTIENDSFFSDKNEGFAYYEKAANQLHFGITTDIGQPTLEEVQEKGEPLGSLAGAKVSFDYDISANKLLNVKFKEGSSKEKLTLNFSDEQLISYAKKILNNMSIYQSSLSSVSFPAYEEEKQIILTKETATKFIRQTLSTFKLNSDNTVSFILPTTIPTDENGKTKLYISSSATFSTAPSTSSVQELLDWNSEWNGGDRYTEKLDVSRGKLTRIFLRVAFMTSTGENSYQEYAADYIEFVEPFNFDTTVNITDRSVKINEVGSSSILNYTLQNGKSFSVTLELPKGLVLLTSENYPEYASKFDYEMPTVVAVKDGTPIGTLALYTFGTNDKDVLMQVDTTKNTMPMQIFAGVALSNHAMYDNYKVCKSSVTGANAVANYSWQDLTNYGGEAPKAPWLKSDCVLAYDYEKAPFFINLNLTDGILSLKELENLAKSIVITN